jgi:hypothetical protein
MQSICAHLALMKKIPLFLALTLTGLLVTSSKAQLFVGSDTFEGGSSAKWSYAIPISSSGLLSFSNNRLDFTKGTGSGGYIRGWDGDGAGTSDRTSASFTTSWVADLTVTNTMGTLSSGFASIGFEVAGSGGNYSALLLSASTSGTFFHTETNASTVGDALATTVNDVHLRLAWDANTQALNSFYSLDGLNYTGFSTFNPVTQWTAGAASNGFFFEIVGNSNISAAITSGSMYADNFSISAVPEPSTYAAFAGVGALGLAVWRRRRARALPKA